MPKIHVLNQDIANKIAAGEVVERPGSVIKELVENAMDAGAVHITVEIMNGGITFMRVTDDGCGMGREDAKNCFLRHATSKIRDISDLYAIETLGFRGEALAAISAVSKIELITSVDGIGTRLVLEAGQEMECEDIGAPQGTTIIVRDLFHNTPARMKFLKTDRAESSYISALIDRLAISNPQIAFKLIQDGKITLNTNGNGNLLDVIYAVMGKEVAKGMLQADTSVQQVHVYGYIAEPTVTKTNRNYQLCYINGRLVRSQTVFAAIDQAYKNELFHGRHAVCVLKITLPYGLVDVNVHPSKMEVKFSNEKLIFEAVYYAIKNALNKQTLLKKEESTVSLREPSAFTITKEKAPMTQVGVADSFGAIKDLKKPEPLIASEKKAANVESISSVLKNKTKTTDADDHIVTLPAQTRFSLGSNSLHETSSIEKPFMTPVIPAKVEVNIPEVQPSVVTEQETIVEIKKEIPYRYIGEVFSSYVLVESEDQLYLIDKHAAHERMIFERLLKENHNKSISEQRLLVPERIQLSQDELNYALERKDDFSRIGFEVDAFGERQIILRSRPVCLTNESATEAFSEILADWIRGGSEERTDRENNALKTVACKAAIKAGNLNDSCELKALVCRLIEEDEIHQCPHGRPVIIAYSKKTIEKAFKRI